jgi:hypothetical protein
MIPSFSKVFAKTFPHFWVLPVWLYHRTVAFRISLDLIGTCDFMVPVPAQEHKAGKAVAATVKALFFKNVRLLSMGGSPLFDGIICTCQFKKLQKQLIEQS